jgi:putative transcription factor
MAGCDLCGKEPLAAIVDIEGARMSVCASCSSYGKSVKRLDQPSAPDPWTIRRARPKAESPKIQAQVRPDLATVLRKARERLNATQEEFSKRLGVKLSAYHHYESGSGVPDIEIARRMERALGTHLVVGVREENPESPVAPTEAKNVTIGDLIRRR